MGWISAAVGGLALLIVIGCDDDRGPETAMQDKTVSAPYGGDGPEVDISVRPAIFTRSTSEVSNPAAKIAQVAETQREHHRHQHRQPVVQIPADDDQSDNQTVATDAAPETAQKPPWQDQLQKARDDQGDPPKWRHQESDPAGKDSSGDSRPQDGSDPGSGEGTTGGQ
jgi:hypothetical protein